MAWHVLKAVMGTGLNLNQMFESALRLIHFALSRWRVVPSSKCCRACYSIPVCSYPILASMYSSVGVRYPRKLRFRVFEKWRTEVITASLNHGVRGERHLIRNNLQSCGRDLASTPQQHFNGTVTYAHVLPGRVQLSEQGVWLENRRNAHSRNPTSYL